MKKSAIILGVLFFSFGASHAQDFLELLKKDLNKEKRSLLAEAMDIKEENKTAFWEIYGEYETASNKLIDSRSSNLNKFADNYENLTDEIADEIASTHMSSKASQLKIQKSTYKKMKKTIGAVQAARFIQIMNQVQLLIDVQIASEVPLIE